MESKPSDFLNTFDKTITSVSKKFKVPSKKLMDFEAEVLSIRERTMKLKEMHKTWIAEQLSLLMIVQFGF